jgi:archaellum component FlaC
MAENNSSTPEQHSSSEPSKTTEEIRERAARLKEKVGDLSKTFERIEQSLAEAADERKDSAA